MINKSLIIGLGQLSRPVAKYVKEKTGFDTYGFDINRKAMESDVAGNTVTADKDNLGNTPTSCI